MAVAHTGTRQKVYSPGRYAKVTKTEIENAVSNPSTFLVTFDRDVTIPVGFDSALCDIFWDDSWTDCTVVAAVSATVLRLTCIRQIGTPEGVRYSLNRVTASGADNTKWLTADDGTQLHGFGKTLPYN